MRSYLLILERRQVE